VYSGVQTAVQSITDLPDRLGNVLKSVLRDLFVPDEEWLQEQSSGLRELVESKVAVVGQLRGVWDSAVAAFGSSGEDWQGIEAEGSFYGVPGSFRVSIWPGAIEQRAPRIRRWVSGAWQLLVVAYVIRRVSDIIRI